MKMNKIKGDKENLSSRSERSSCKSLKMSTAKKIKKWLML